MESHVHFNGSESRILYLCREIGPLAVSVDHLRKAYGTVAAGRWYEQS